MEENGSTNDSLILYGFDEVGMFENEFSKPVYGFLKCNCTSKKN
jgi:hypothetical protein